VNRCLKVLYLTCTLHMHVHICMHVLGDETQSDMNIDLDFTSSGSCSTSFLLPLLPEPAVEIARHTLYSPPTIDTVSPVCIDNSEVFTTPATPTGELPGKRDLLTLFSTARFTSPRDSTFTGWLGLEHNIRH